MTEDKTPEETNDDQPKTYRESFDELIKKIVVWRGECREPSSDLTCGAALELRKLTLQGIRERLLVGSVVQKYISQYIDNKAKERALEYVKKHKVTIESEQSWFAAKIMDRHSCAIRIINFLTTPPPKVTPRRR